MKMQGHLSDCPLPDLLTILAKRRESGCLEISFKPVPGTFYFKDGKLVDAKMGRLEGFSAINLAFSMDKAPFHFDNLALPRESTINDQNQRLILSRLMGNRVGDPKETDNGSETRAPRGLPTPTPSTPTSSNLLSNQPLGNKLTRSAPIFGTQGLSNLGSQRLTASGLTILLIGVLALVGFAVRFGRGKAATPGATVSRASDSAGGTSAPAVANEQLSESRTPSATSIDKPRDPDPGRVAVRTTASSLPATDRPRHMEENSPTQGESNQSRTEPDRIRTDANQNRTEPDQTRTDANQNQAKSSQKVTSSGELKQPGPTSKMITVMVQIVDGRVVEAYVRDRHQGLEAYEATAIRLARQRHYSREMTGKETVVVEVTREP